MAARLLSAKPYNNACRRGAAGFSSARCLESKASSPEGKVKPSPIGRGRQSCVGKRGRDWRSLEGTATGHRSTMHSAEAAARAKLKGARRIVVKLGTSTVTDPEGGVCAGRVEPIVRAIARLAAE